MIAHTLEFDILYEDWQILAAELNLLKTLKLLNGILSEGSMEWPNDDGDHNDRWSRVISIFNGIKKNDSWFLEMNRNVELVSTEILEKLTWKLMETWLDNNNSRFLGLRQGLARD